ncbi:Zinc metalloproteinase nas-31 [Caenorhabditis elegans]|uniref:Zinc metalloproteinase nas-31 n=1 Tax=Caenorhabditis elegans TaxID=6239 RepID=NAS31_CAEEL|nr:Zinc metalloproteinase nas-31 [Caenorhabditis elegans]Q7JLI1.1 RecName: Full=Zinc metalloproteinase nas-31; AltName: Full=Nematode astacin 31; Flags: Precursor [Caenorhabditis elegans]CAE48502.1 Zinc metalloproteinase nas-31 [Caenorhabditis elegans]|eukprot:NP_001023994.1 Zinc metalloproteinase nas-31 [Caenorhabditis elegans]
MILQLLFYSLFTHLAVSQIDVNQALNQNKLNIDTISSSAISDAELEKTFPRTNLSRMRNALKSLRQNWSAKLQAMPARNYQNAGTNQENGATEQQKPLREKPRDRVKMEGDTLHQVNKAAGLNDILYQGDMVLTDDQIATILEARDETTVSTASRARRQAYRDRYYPSTTWGSSVYYYYDRTATPKIVKAFEQAVAFWQNVTCINIMQSSTAINRIRVFKGQGCYSYVGRISGVQDLSLGTGCEEFGTAAHELGHALGFFHTQSRYDRDNYISINYANIDPSYVEQFDKETSNTNFNYGMPYDYGSIMQYGATSASSNDKATMIARDTEYQDTMGSDFVGFYDISMMNEHYKCKELCPAASSAQCKNGGFPSPRNCAICICPSGYGGILCDQRPPGCGDSVTATTTWQTLTNTIGDGLPTLRDNHTMCNYWVKAPDNQAVEIRISGLTTVTIDGCIFGGVEIKTHKDQKLTGYRYCSSADQNTVHRSTGSLVPIILFNRYASTKAVLEYRAVTPSVDVSATYTTFAPIVNSCQDLHPNCDFYKFFGMCRSKKIRSNCKFTCHDCNNNNASPFGSNFFNNNYNSFNNWYTNKNKNYYPYSNSNNNKPWMWFF